MYVFIFHSTQNIMLEGQPCLRALTAARNKMYRSNIDSMTCNMTQ